MFIAGRRIHILGSNAGTRNPVLPLPGGPGSETRPPLYIFHDFEGKHYVSLEEVPAEAVAEEDDIETLDVRAETAAVEDDDDNENHEIVMEDVRENPVIANDDDDEEDDEWDENPYNFVDVSDTASDTGSNVDPDIFY